jgi:hypothetical protein
LEEEARDGTAHLRQQYRQCWKEGRKEEIVGDTSMTSLMKRDSDFFNSGGMNNRKESEHSRWKGQGNGTRRRRTGNMVLGGM